MQSGKKVVLSSMALILTMLASTALAQRRRPSTPEERSAVVELSKELQENPLHKDLWRRYRRLFYVLTDVPDFTVTICGGIPWITSEEKYKYTAELTGIYTMANAAYVVSHLDKPDVRAAHLAGLEGAIKAYQAIVVEEPRAKWQPMEDLLAKQKSGELQKLLPTFCSRKN